MADISNINLPNGENYDIKDKVARNDIALNRTTLGTQCRNLLPYSKSIVKGGITFTCDENGYMTASNTANDARQWTAYNSQYNVKLKSGKYILSFVSASVCTNAYGNIMVLSANDKVIVGIGQTNYYKKTSGAIEFTIDTEQTVYIMSKIFDGKTAIMLRYADITDSNYEPYKPSLQEQIDNFGTQQQLLCDYSSEATSSVTIQIAGLFSNYSAVICTVKYYLGTTSITLPLKYIKSIGKSKEYSPVSDLRFKYIDDNNLFIGGADAAINNVKIISLY